LKQVFDKDGVSCKPLFNKYLWRCCVPKS
jgi:hypothetical protein